MSIATVKVKPFGLPNFLTLEKGGAFDVADLLPTDEDAARFWDESKARWVAHVRKRRAVTGFPVDGGVES